MWTLDLSSQNRSLSASEETAQAAIADLPIPQHLASKEDLQL